jgi:predicted Rossmann fold nucleotide-binding protein DprA/Smf involved in DNA uptake
VIEGDADGELRFLEPGGAELGKLAGGDPIGSPLPIAVVSDGAVLRQVLAAMGGRGGWHPDLLCQRSGIPYRKLTAALLELRLAGTVRCDPAGLYHAG